MPPPRNDNPRRKNGFSTPYAGAQLSTWIALPMLVVEFVLLVAPVLPLAAMIPCTIIFALTAVLAAYYAFLAQYIDPMDEHLEKHLKQMEENNNEPAANGFGSCLGGVNDEVEPLKHCWICDTQVSEHAMHCKFCNKCVGNFDHHCMCKSVIIISIIMLLKRAWRGLEWRAQVGWCKCVRFALIGVSMNLTVFFSSFFKFQNTMKPAIPSCQLLSIATTKQRNVKTLQGSIRVWERPTTITFY